MGFSKKDLNFIQIAKSGKIAIECDSNGFIA